ncbi:RidA family protein [Sphingomonas naphthae]|uniref:RidA family protein n=1 Tax=Sphingomonas naphthae TaxID=1813468 RepID=A0ABY7TIZ8_9SPHN|nr:RidA family protein [Sphingomonas naphthae]WCT72915.1 RidA family protein [Sphingomonas naphthae]
MKIFAFALPLAMALAAPATAGVVKLPNTPPALILQGSKVSAGTELFFVSGQVPSPIDPKLKAADAKSIEDFGDTKTQTISVLSKIKAILEGQGYTMSDVIKATVLVAADPRTGKAEFAAMNEGFKQFFNSADNPTTTARSAMQVAGLVTPNYLVEIEVIAAK